ncbi:MAG TPA: NAD-binding protein [Gemmatimonadota bacterium]|nr:NAD-binding protein [Gemmatimonadota bacterium]
MPAQFAYILHQPSQRRNLRSLGMYFAFLAIVIAVYTVTFHWIMWSVEGQRHSWVTGLYWTLTVMSTLGFGDITFQSDVGRLFTVLVLLSGMILLLIVLPFAFISFFYAPWLEARLRTRAPRELPSDTADHVLLCGYDSVAKGLGGRLAVRGVSWFVVEPDPDRANELYAEGIPVATGPLSSPATWRAMRVERARLVVANRDDRTDSAIALAIRDASADTEVVAIAEDPDAVDVLELSGCDHVLDLKRQLGEHLAARVDAGVSGAHVVGSFRDQRIAEFTVHGTPLAGRTIRDLALREITGLNVVGVWKRGRLEPARPDTVLDDYSVPVVVGTVSQITDLESLLVIHRANFNPVVVIGGGRVGRAAARALTVRNIPVHVIERDPSLESRIAPLSDRLIVGDAADREVLHEAGLEEAPSVVLTTNDDATNMFLTLYCRKIQPDLRIVSRITEERNVEAVYRAGADFVLSYATLGVRSIFAILERRELVVIGEGTDLFRIPVSERLDGQTLAESDIGARTGLNVVAIESDGDAVTNPGPDAVLERGSELLVIGTLEGRQRFMEEYEA